jgi:hypothetical protein
MRCASVIALLAALFPAWGAAQAQQDTAARPFARVTLDKPRVIVGQKTTLRIEVFAPNYMTAPPELPGFQIHNAVTRQLRNVNVNEQREGTSFAGVQFEFTIYPQEPGSYAVTDQKIHVKYAAEPPATREVDVALPPVAFEAFIPDAAAELRPFLAATKLSVEQTIKRSSDRLKAGDAVTRTVTIKAEGAPAMLLPPHQFVAIDGLRLYPAQPALDDRTDGRTDVLTSTRVESATYMVEHPGDYSLPAIDIEWWNVSSGKVEQVHLDAVPFKVVGDETARNRAAIDGPGWSWTWDSLVDLVADHWLAAVLVTLIAAALAWFVPGTVRRITDYQRRRRKAYLQSEAFAFDRLRRAVRGRDPRTAYFALLDWLPHLDGASSSDSLGTFKAAAGDPELDRQLGALENELFAEQPDAHRWSPRQLLHGVSAARRRLRPRAGRRENMSLPQSLNPAAASNAPAYAGRRPAR